MMGKVINSAHPILKVAGITIDASVPCKSGNYVNYGSRLVEYIVVHYTGNNKDTAWANASYFHRGLREASAHYFVDELEVYQSVEARDAAWHCGASNPWHPRCRNTNSIGIEMCTSGSYKVSAKTKANTVALVAAWCRLLGYGPGDVDTYVLRHYDVTGKWCPMQMAGKNNLEWQAFKAAVKAALGGGMTPAPKPTTNREEYCEVNVPILRQGSSNGYVRTLQILLNKYNNAHLTEDGIFGQGTYNAVRAYQRSRGLAVDGIVGAATWAYLLK